jgi:PBP1b-binding outer membrane lipoprotein LpoB
MNKILLIGLSVLFLSGCAAYDEVKSKAEEVWTVTFSSPTSESDLVTSDGLVIQELITSY